MLKHMPAEHQAQYDVLNLNDSCLLRIGKISLIYKWRQTFRVIYLFYQGKNIRTVQNQYSMSLFFKTDFSFKLYYILFSSPDPKAHKVSL